eukprot:TRINITY_DN52540_c0_g1_i2.p2 TRINITY_DN52540_c0_g1~~TRINITY_DN52540_c0_g1_i2.p2  ORF type:complete len:193 (+),score=21.77 TRINITY_DN52540_c0_g1_i2:57-635(+)
MSGNDQSKEVQRQSAQQEERQVVVRGWFGAVEAYKVNPTAQVGHLVKKHSSVVGVLPSTMRLIKDRDYAPHWWQRFPPTRKFLNNWDPIPDEPLRVVYPWRYHFAPWTEPDHCVNEAVVPLIVSGFSGMINGMGVALCTLYFLSAGRRWAANAECKHKPTGASWPVKYWWDDSASYDCVPKYLSPGGDATAQ